MHARNRRLMVEWNCTKSLGFKMGLQTKCEAKLAEYTGDADRLAVHRRRLQYWNIWQHSVSAAVPVNDDDDDNDDNVTWRRLMNQLWCIGWQRRSIRVQRPAEQVDSHRRQQPRFRPLSAVGCRSRPFLRRLDSSDHCQQPIEPTDATVLMSSRRQHVHCFLRPH